MLSKKTKNEKHKAFWGTLYLNFSSIKQVISNAEDISTDINAKAIFKDFEEKGRSRK